MFLRHRFIQGKASLHRKKVQTHFFLSIFNPEHPHYQVWKFRKVIFSFCHSVFFFFMGQHCHLLVLVKNTFYNSYKLVIVWQT